MADFAGRELCGRPFRLTTDKQELLNTKDVCINYSEEKIEGNIYHISPHTLLFEQEIKTQEILFTQNELPFFFPTSGDHPFDIFAASFYLLSRYEEYLSHARDMYGRFDHTTSLAFREKFLHRPLVNEWFSDLRNRLQQKGYALSNNRQFTFLPTYDIDIAWSYKYKGWKRNAGGLIRDLFIGQFGRIKTRIAVLRGKKQDPFDCYGWLNGLHEKNRLRPYYFFLLADKTGKRDKNISPKHTALKALIADHAIRYPAGIHPSWQSGDKPALVEKEIANLSSITGQPVQASRQHYIRFSLPETFRLLAEKGIRFDFSMGYGSINGFRASVCTPYTWYDLHKEETSLLQLFPFCYMDANSFYEQKDDTSAALNEMRLLFSAVEKEKGVCSMIWHNTFLGTDPLYAGWRELYESFIREISSRLPASF